MRYLVDEKSLDFFSFLTEVFRPLLLPMLSQEKEKLIEKFVDNEGTRKDHQIFVIDTSETSTSEKNNSIYSLFSFFRRLFVDETAILVVSRYIKMTKSK
jgi:archaellum biogenesis ATPase FlaH